MNKEENSELIIEQDGNTSPDNGTIFELHHLEPDGKKAGAVSTPLSIRDLAIETFEKIKEVKRALNERYAKMNLELETDQRYFEDQVRVREEALSDIERRFKDTESENMDELLKELDKEIMRPFASLETCFDLREEGNRYGN